MYKNLVEQKEAIMSTSLSAIVKQALPSLSGNSLTYNAEKNVYLTHGYTSAAGNTYYKVARFSKHLAVLYNIGEGYAHTFLNGITLFCWDNRKAKIIAQKFWGGYNWKWFTEQFAKEQSILMLKEFIEGQVKAVGGEASEQQIMAYARTMIEETQQRYLA